MFGAMFRWFKAVGYLLTGQIDAARRTLDLNPHVMRAKYDEVIAEKTSRIQQYKQAVAGLIAQQESKMQKVKTLSEDILRIKTLQAGALAKAKQKAAQLQAQGKSVDDIKRDEEYMKCQSAYQDFSSTLSEKEARITELEADIADYGKRTSEHKVQLQSLLRELDKVRAEQADAVADVVTAREEKEIADVIAGIAEDGTAAELQRMRQLRQEIKAEARISRELAGTDTRAQEAEFMHYAQRDEAAAQFDQLIGLAASADKQAAPESAPDAKTKAPGLPE